MLLIEWERKYETGVPEMDQHHKRLVQLLNDLYDGVITCADLKQEQELTQYALAELIHYTQYHFTAEEKLLAGCHYPDLASQQQQHATLIAKVIDLQQQVQAGVLSLSFSTLILIRDWLMGHILGNDTKYGPYLTK